MKLKNSNCDKDKNLIGMKLKNSNLDETKKNQMVPKLKTCTNLKL